MGRARRPAPRPRGRTRAGSARRRLAVLAGVVLASALVHSLFLEGYWIPSRSMEDTLLLGDVLLVEKVSDGVRVPFLGLRLPALSAPRPGDVVVFHSPEGDGRALVKRCVAAAGQTVEVRDKIVYVDGERLVDPTYSKYLDPRILPADLGGRDNLAPLTVPPGALFVMGDNRDNSRDSRHWGFLPVDRILGRPLRVLLSIAPAATEGDGAGLWAQLQSLPGRTRWSRLGTGTR